MKYLLLSFLALASYTTEAREIVLTSGNTLVLNQMVDEVSMGKLMNEAAQIDTPVKSQDQLILVLSTPGGYVDIGNQGINYLSNINRPVDTLTLFAASMGFHTVQGLGNRYITPDGTLMSHKMRGATFGEIPGQADSRYAHTLRMVDRMDKKVVERTNGKQTLESYRRLYENEVWLDGQDAVEQGFADEVVTARCDDSLKGSHNDSFDFFGFTINVELSNCPLNQGVIGINVALHTDQGMLPMNEFLKKGGAFSNKIERPWGASNPVLTNPDLTLEKINQEKDKIIKRYRVNKLEATEYLRSIGLM